MEAQAERVETHVSIVALGGFNPAILHPVWFSVNNLIPEEEAEKANIEIVNREIAVFQTDWFGLQVLGDRFVVDTRDLAKHMPLRDLAIGTFQLLEHTPIHSFGLNAQYHWRFETEKEMDQLRKHYLTGKSWDNLLDDANLGSLSVTGKRNECNADCINIKIDESNLNKLVARVSVNEHYGYKGSGSVPENRIDDFRETLKDGWDGFLKYTENVTAAILGECCEE